MRSWEHVRALGDDALSQLLSTRSAAHTILRYRLHLQLRTLFLTTSRLFSMQHDEFSADQKAPGTEVREK